MADQRLLDYIHQSRQAGYPVAMIRQKLLESGWPSGLVDQALHEAGPPETSRTPQEQQPASQAQPAGKGGLPGVIEKLKLNILHPQEFFDRVRDEEGYEGPVKFYLLVELINLAIANIILLLLSTFVPSLTQIAGVLGPFDVLTGMLNDILYANLTIILSILGTFLAAGIVHIFSLIFGAKGGYHSTYRALIYASGPSILILPFALIPLAGIFISFSILIYSLYLFLKGLSTFHNISMPRAFGIATAMVITLLAMVFAFALITTMLLISYIGPLGA
jgi:hypothetical protein